MDLEDRVEQDRELDDVPLKLTEERIRTEWERGANPRNLDSAPLLLEEHAPAAEPSEEQASIATELSPGASPPTTATTDPAAVMPDVQVRRPRSGSILHLDEAPPANEPAARALMPDVQIRQPQSGSILQLDEAPTRPAPQPLGSWKLVRKHGRSRGLWTAVLVLALVLTGVLAYSYLAFQRNSVDVSALPGAATVRTVRAEAANARAEASSAGNKARPVLAATAQRVEQAAVEVRGRYEQWRARH